MLQAGTMDEGDKVLMLDLTVRCSNRQPMVFKFWMAELAGDYLRLAAERARKVRHDGGDQPAP